MQWLQHRIVIFVCKRVGGTINELTFLTACCSRGRLHAGSPLSFGHSRIQLVWKLYDLSLCQYRRSYIFTNKDHVSGFVSVQRGAILKGRIACTECKDAACCCRCSVVCLCVRECLFVGPVSSIGWTDRDAVCVWWAQRTIKLGPRSCKGKEQLRGMLPTPIRSTLKGGIILSIPIVPAACSRSTRFS